MSLGAQLRHFRTFEKARIDSYGVKLASICVCSLPRACARNIHFAALTHSTMFSIFCMVGLLSSGVGVGMWVLWI